MQQQDELVHELVEIRFVLAFTLDLLHGMDHRGVMLTPEAAADLGERTASQSLAKIHRYLSRKRYLACVVLGFKATDWKIVVVADVFHDAVDGRRRGFRNKHVPQCLLGEFQRDFLATDRGVSNNLVVGSFQFADIRDDRCGA